MDPHNVVGREGNPLVRDVHDAIGQMGKGIELSVKPIHIDELVDHVVAFVEAIRAKPIDSVLHSLISQSIVPTLVRQKRFAPDVARRAKYLEARMAVNLNKFTKEALSDAYQAKQEFSELVTLAPIGTTDFIFRTDLPRTHSHYRYVRTEVFPLEDFIGYYTDDSHALGRFSQDQAILLVENANRGDPIALMAARYLRFRVQVMKDPIWIDQVSKADDLIDAGYRIYAVMATHLLRERQVSLYGLTNVDFPYDEEGERTKEDGLDQLYHGFVQTPSASAAEVSSYFIGVPFVEEDMEISEEGSPKMRTVRKKTGVEFFLPLVFSLLHFIHTRGHVDFITVDRELTTSIMTHAVWDNDKMSGDLTRAFQMFLDVTPIGEPIQVTNETGTKIDKMVTKSNKPEGTRLRSIAATLKKFSDTLENDGSSEQRSDAFTTFVEELVTYIVQCNTDVLDRARFSKQVRRLKAQITDLGHTPVSSNAQTAWVSLEETSLSDIIGTEMDTSERMDEDEDERVSALWHIGQYGRDDVWASCSVSASILKDAGDIWRGGIVLET